jgi:hypothetical protein
VVVSTAQLTSFPIGHASSSLHLEDDVVLQFDATHRLSELIVSWGRLAWLPLESSSRLELLLFIFVLWSFDFFYFFFLSSCYSCWRSPSLRITLASLA